MTAANRRTVLIYAAVRDVRMLDQGFYAAEADGLRAHPGIAQVRLTNRLSDVARGDFHGLVSFFYSHSALACLLARLRGRPAVVTGGAEQVFPHLAGTGWRWLARLTAFRMTALFATRILATSTSDVARMRDIIWFGHEKLALSFHGAPAADHVVTTPLDGRPAGSFVTICGLDTPANVARKGVLDAVDLLARAADECATAYLTIIGRTTCRSLVEDHARALGVVDRLRFAGYVAEEEKLTLLQNHRYYIQLSIYEGFGIGALEAIAQGCQVIHSGAGGLADTVAEFGVVVPRKRVRDFSLAELPRYHPSASALTQHLARFSPKVRAGALFAALFGR